MGYDLSITRAPIWTGRPGRSLTLEEWFDVIRRDEELCFAPSGDPRKYPSCDAEWLAHPKPEEAPHGTFFSWSGGDITCKYPDEYQMLKMVQISRKLNAIVIGDNGERYELDENGKLVVRDDGEPPPSPGPTTYGIGFNPGERFIQAIQTPKAPEGPMFYQWYLGLLTSVNSMRFRDGKTVMTFPLTPELVREDHTYLFQYCQEHPKRTFHQAALSLIELRLARCGP